MIFRNEPGCTLTPSLKAQRYLRRQISGEVKRFLLNNPVRLYCKTRKAHAWIGRERNENTLCGWHIVAECLDPDGRGNRWNVLENSTHYDSEIRSTAARAVADYCSRFPTDADSLTFTRSKRGWIMMKGNATPIDGLTFRQLLELRKRFESNTLGLKVPEEIGAPNFLTTCLETLRKYCGPAHFFDEDMSVEFTHQGGETFTFKVPLGRHEDVIYPLNIAGHLGTFRQRRLKACHLPVSPWVCSIWAEALCGSNHYYPAVGNSPLEALHAACELTHDPVHVSAAGHIRLGFSRNIQWRFHPNTMRWEHMNERHRDRGFAEFEPYLRSIIWEKLQAYPKLAAEILLDMATM